MSMACAATFAAWAGVVARGDASSGGQSTRLNALAMLAAGFFISGPDGILGGAVSKNLCEYNGKGAKGDGWGPAVSGYVNGCASVGVMGMSALTPKLLGLLGWSGLFGLLAAMMSAAAALSLPAALLEARHFTNAAAASKKK
jgi:sugar phosphate permease